MESPSSSEAMKCDEATYGQRRKSQNRLAQRRFREKAKLRKNANQKSSEAENDLSKRTQGDRQPGLSDEHGLSIENEVDFMWQHTSGITDETQNLNPLRTDGYDNVVRAAPDTQILSQQVQTPSKTFQFHEPNVSLGSGLCLDENHFAIITDQISPNRQSSQDTRRASIPDRAVSRACPGEYEAMHEQPRHYQSVIQGQRLHLYSQAGKFVDQSISLLDAGVLLGILPNNPHLRDLLTSAQVAIQSRASLNDGE